jgi:molybdenum cofactor guanylyltransferase
MDSKLNNYTAYILCGGKSSRFGKDKALVELKGKKIIEIIANELEKVFIKIVLVTPKPEKYAFLNLECISDIYVNCGPLAGIHAALKHSGTEKNFIISCDMPKIKKEVIRYIADFKTGKDIIIPKTGDKKHYLCALYGKCVLSKTEELLEQTKDMEKCASPYDLINVTGYELIDFNTLELFDGNSFFNLNSQEELEKL